MRPLALALLVLGFLGIALGLLSAIVPGAGIVTVRESTATWHGVGPMIAGLVMVLGGLYLLRNSARL